MERALKVFLEHVPEYVERSIDRVLAAEVPLYLKLPREVLRGSIGKAFEVVREDLLNETNTAYAAYLSMLGSERAKQGAPVREMIIGLDLGFQVVSDHFKEVFAEDYEAQLWWEERRGQISYSGAIAITDTFYVAREAVITEQSNQILRQSAPILPLYDGVLVMPIVGTIGEKRAGQILESLLNSVVRNRTVCVIIDITGVPALDKSAAGHLIQASHATRLLGAQVVLVGISPATAATMADLAIDLEGITILGNLQSGVEHALRRRGRAITSVR